MVAYVLLDRDGTIIEHVHHLSKLSEIQIKSDAFSALMKLKNVNFRLGIITNQSVVGLKILSIRELDEIHENLSNAFANHGITFDFIFYCPHLVTDGCNCRKPELALGIKAVKEFGLTPNASFMIGDQISDVEFGIQLGVSTIIINRSLGKENRADFSCDNLTEAAEWIVAQRQQELNR